MEKSNNDELENKVLEIGKKYKNADKPTKIEVGKIMLGKIKKFKKKKKLIDTTNIYKQGVIHRINDKFSNYSLSYKLLKNQCY